MRTVNPPPPAKRGAKTWWLTVAEAARQLGVPRTALSRVLNGHAAISPEMALRLEQWLGIENSGQADLWIAQQAAYDLWQARQKGVPHVERVHLAA